MSDNHEELKQWPFRMSRKSQLRNWIRIVCHHPKKLLGDVVPQLMFVFPFISDSVLLDFGDELFNVAHMHQPFLAL